MSHSEALRFIAVRSIGNFLILFALYGVVMTFGPAAMAEMKYRAIQFRGVKFSISDVAKNSSATASRFERPKEQQIPSQVSFADILAGSKQQILTPIDPLFSILIPKIGANARIYPNVDPDNPQAYLPILQHGVAHARGSVFPGFPGTTYLFAHSADNWWDAGRYNAVFYTLINLSEGDEIDVFFENTRYTYRVSQKLIADPNDISYLTSEHSGQQRLVLQTCWPPGTTLRRLYIIAVPKQMVN